MSRIVLGKSDKKNVELDLPTLLRTHLLIWASTGGGKSRLIRRVGENAFGKVPVIILDREGEFSTLREKFGFVLVGQGGETPADVRSAKLLAEKLLELRASAVCDLYDLKHETRHEWVKTFVSALVDAPKRLWGPTLIVLDEAHTWCPEKGQGESPAYGPVVDLAGLGRKRGFGLIFATQRLSKLSKNATAEMFNQAAGPTATQADRDRAAYEMGVSKGKDALEFSETLRRLEPGHFWFQGRAISMDRVLVHVGEVQTTHPEPGTTKFRAGPPPAPETVKALLPKLADLPKAAEEKAKTEAELRAKIRSLEAQLRTHPVKTEMKTVQVVDPKAIERAVRASEQQAQKQLVAIHASRKKLMANGGQLARALTQLAEAAKKAFIVEVAEDQHAAIPAKLTFNREPLPAPAAIERPALPAPAQRSIAEPAGPPALDSDEKISAPQMKLLTCLAEMEAIGRLKVHRKHLAAMAGVSHKSGGGYDNNLGRLRTLGLITYPAPGEVSLTQQGRGLAPALEVPRDANEMLARCLKVVTGPQGKILSELFKVHPEAMSRPDLAHKVGVSPNSGGGYDNNLGALRSAGMIDYPAPGMVRCADWLFIN